MTENQHKPRIGDPRPKVEEDPFGIYKPPLSMEERNRRFRERESDEAMAREASKLSQSLVAIQEAKRAVHGPTVSDGLVPGQRHPSPELPAGELGDGVRALVRWDKLEAARSRARARITVEQAERAEDDRGLKSTASALAQAALRAGAKRETVPPTWTPLVEAAIEAETAALPRTAELERMIFGAIDAQTIEAARNALRDALPEIDVLAREAATRAIQKATEAHERLTLSGVTVDVDIREAATVGDAGILAALKCWNEAVAGWDDAQTVRAWCAAADVRGLEITSKGAIVVVPPPRIPSGPYAQKNKIDAATALAGVEARTLGSPWRGVRMPLRLREGSAHEVVRWYVQRTETDRPQPRGVIEEQSTE